MPRKKAKPARAKPAPKRAPEAGPAFARPAARPAPMPAALPEARPLPRPAPLPLAPLPKETPTTLVASLEKRPLAPEDHAPLERLAEVVVFSTLFTAGAAAILFLLRTPASILFPLAIILWLALTAAWLYHKKRQRA